MKRLHSFIFFLLIINLSCGQTKSQHITEFLKESPKDVILIDVRTPQEYHSGHLENAQNINWFDADFADKFSVIDKDKTIYVYCKVGGRSAKAQEKLLSMGYKNVINLEGGYDDVLASKK
ncbi:rhodanese-like domain-containing protein [Maribacter chungangensis]|uniref:Rhodanese-like domain-containing protein n=1 Tax=Maribacter chungangensis TaxID=1069117 RepID=A0ABW3B0I0_9FLAO